MRLCMTLEVIDGNLYFPRQSEVELLAVYLVDTA
jgi:hypothetical protein